MSYKDLFDEAEILDSLAWLGMPDEARIQKLASLYRKKEKDIRYYHRNYQGPTYGVVSTFVKSLFQPARGQLKLTVEKVIQEVGRQKEIREKRRTEFSPFVWSKPDLRDRRNALARARYTIFTKDWRGQKERVGHRCMSVGSVGDVFLMVDAGSGYSTKSRIYMKHRPTNKVKVVVLEDRGANNITSAMMALAPKIAMRSMFDGATIKLDFESESFLVNGEPVKWSGVRRIYRGAKRAHKTWADPKKQD